MAGKETPNFFTVMVTGQVESAEVRARAEKLDFHLVNPVSFVPAPPALSALFQNSFLT